MATLRCRACGADINSETRRTRCPCGELFPLQCAVCEKPLRPPLLVFPDERHLTAEFKPLCEAHYERQCPDCGKWFRADENPGYFRCTACAAAHERASQEANRKLQDVRMPPSMPVTAPKPAETSRSSESVAAKTVSKRAPVTFIPVIAFGAAIIYGLWQVLQGMGGR